MRGKMKTNYNTRSPGEISATLPDQSSVLALCSIDYVAVRRLMKEAIELKDPTSMYHAQPLEVSLQVINSLSCRVLCVRSLI